VTGASADSARLPKLFVAYILGYTARYLIDNTRKTIVLADYQVSE
jgi:hypothetical protein